MMDPKVVKVAKVTLPFKYEVLYRLFTEIEQVCMLMHTRKQEAKLDIVRKNVAKNITHGSRQSMPGVTPERIAQILYIYPNSYTIKLTAAKSSVTGNALKTQYAIVPNLSDDLYPYYKKPDNSLFCTPSGDDKTLVAPTPPISPQKMRQIGVNDYVIRSPKKSPTKPLARPARLDFGPKFEAWRRQCRAQIFKYKLFEYLKGEQEKFLCDKNIKFDESKEEKVFCAEFLLENLPEIPAINLPAPERPAIQRTMAEYLAVIQQSPVLRSVEKVTKQLKTPVKVKPEEAQLSLSSVSSSKQEPSSSRPPLLMKSRMNLLERIREKEREAKKREAARDLKMEKRLSRLEELKIRALNVIYSEYAKRTSIEQSALYKRVNIATGIRQEEFNGIVEILAEIASQHFSLYTLKSNNTRYLKMLDKDLAQITKIVDDEIARCRERIQQLLQ